MNGSLLPYGRRDSNRALFTLVYQKECFRYKKKKWIPEYHHWILHIRINLGTKFQLKLTIWFAGSNLLKKGIPVLKKKKWTPPLNSAYSNQSRYQISVKTDNFDFLDHISSKGVFPVKNRKNMVVRVSMVVTYYIKLFRKGADRHSGILMSLLLLVAETKTRETVELRNKEILEWLYKIIISLLKLLQWIAFFSN